MTNLTFITGELGILGIVGSEAMDAGVSVGPQSLNMTKHAGIAFTKGYSNSVSCRNRSKKDRRDDKYITKFILLRERESSG